MLPSPDDLIETFDLLPDWEARYGYLIDLGRSLPDMDPALKTDDVLVPGCTSRVWLVVEKNNPLSPSGGGQGGGDVCRFHIASDAAIVQGLCAVVMCFVQDRTADNIRAIDFEATFKRLHLDGHLSPNRRNGFFAMVSRIKHLAD